MKLADIEVMLGSNQLGKDAIALQKKHNVPLKFLKTGHPARYLPDVPAIEMNETYPKPVIAAYFVHEMNHVKHDKNGTSGNVDKQSQDDFVNQMVNEEIQGTTMQYAFYLDLEKKAVYTQNVTPPIEYPMYRSAYNYGRKLETEKDPKASEETLHAAGLKRGAAMVRVMIDAKDWRDRRLAGGGTPPVTISYREMYVNEWKRAKAKRDKAEKDKEKEKGK